MIGMNQIKKRLLHGILIGLGIGLVFIILTIVLTNNVVKGYEKGTNKNFLANFTGSVVTFNRDVIQGEKITPDMLLNTRVHVSTLPSDTAYAGSIVGRIAKYNIPRNIAIVNSMLSDRIVGLDVRVQEISAVLLPTDIAVNDYVDIRIMYPSGIEYTVLPQKQIKNIVGQNIWMDLSEEELLIMNSAMVDSYMTAGTKLYAVQYTDPTTQIKFSESEMEQAKMFITDKIVEELNSVIKTAEVEKTEVKKAVDNVLTETKELIEDKSLVSVNPYAEASTIIKTNETTNNANALVKKQSLFGWIKSLFTGKEETGLVTPVVVMPERTKEEYMINPINIEETTEEITEETKPRYVINSGKINVDDLIDLVTKYAIEYRYYVEAYNKIEANYQPNQQVMSFMRTHKNIVDQAKAKLSENVRANMEDSVKAFETKSGEAYGLIVSGIQSSISSQQALRSGMLSPQNMITPGM